MKILVFREKLSILMMEKKKLVVQVETFSSCRVFVNVAAKGSNYQLRGVEHIKFGDLLKQIFFHPSAFFSDCVTNVQTATDDDLDR